MQATHINPETNRVVDIGAVAPKNNRIVVEVENEPYPNIGDIYDPVTGDFSTPPPAPPKYRTVMTPGEFKRMFTLNERVRITQARNVTDTTGPAYDLKVALNIFYEDIDDLRLSEVDVTSPTVTDGLTILQATGLLDPTDPGEDTRSTIIQRGILITE